MQIKISELQEEEEKLRKIINIVRPTTLPELTKPQVEENLPKVEKIFKVNPTSNDSHSSIIPTLPKEVKNIEEIKPNVEYEVKAVANNKYDNLKETEGIIIKLITI